MITQAARLSIVAVLATTVASASSNAADDPKVVEARQRMHEGKTLYAAQKFEEARIKYVQACAVLHTPNCIRGLAFTEYRSGNVLDAYRHFKEITDDPKEVAQWEPRVREDVMKFMADAYKQTGHIDITAPADARITVDGAPVGDSPLRGPIDVMPGEHEVAAKIGASQRNAHARVNAVAGQLVMVKLEAESTPPAPAPVASSSPTTVPAAPVATAPPSSDAVSKPRSTFWTTRNSMIVGAGAGALIAAGLGIGFSLAANGHSNDANAIRMRLPASGCGGAGSTSSPDCDNLRSAVDSQASDAHVATGAFVAAGVFAAAGVAMLFFWPSQHDERQARTWFAPVATKGGGAMTVGGTF